MKKTDQVPKPDADFDQFQNEIYAAAGDNLAEWGIPTEVYDALKPFRDAWIAAWALAKDKDDRTSKQVQDKEDARIAYDPVLRQFIQQWLIRNPKVSNGELTSLALKRRPKTNSKVPPPGTWPVVTVKPGHGNQLKLFFRQETSEAGTKQSGKPEGVDRCEFYYKVGGNAPATYKDCPEIGSTGKSPLVLSFATDQAGLKVYGFARWVNTTNQPGPWTPAYFATVIPA